MAEIICGWSDVGSPGKPYPIISQTERKVKSLDLTGDRYLTYTEAKKLAKWWSCCLYDVKVIKMGTNRYCVIGYLERWI